jgi:hypothetical protein
MKFLQLETVLAEVESRLGNPLDETGRGCVENAVDGYNGGGSGLREIKQSLREGAEGLLALGDNSLLSVLDLTEEVCDRMLRSGIVESN